MLSYWYLVPCTLVPMQLGMQKVETCWLYHQSQMPYSSTSLQVTPLFEETDICTLMQQCYCFSGYHLFPTGGILPWVSPAWRLTLHMSCINSGYLPCQGENKLHIHLERRLNNDCLLICMVPRLLDHVMMNVLWISCGRPLQIIWYFLWTATHKWSPYLLGGCHVRGGFITLSAGLPQPGARRRPGLGRLTVP